MRYDKKQGAWEAQGWGGCGIQEEVGTSMPRSSHSARINDASQVTDNTLGRRPRTKDIKTRYLVLGQPQHPGHSDL